MKLICEFLLGISLLNLVCKTEASQGILPPKLILSSTTTASPCFDFPRGICPPCFYTPQGCPECEYEERGCLVIPSKPDEGQFDECTFKRITGIDDPNCSPPPETTTKKSGYSYTTPKIPFPEPEEKKPTEPPETTTKKSGYSYTTPKIPFPEPEEKKPTEPPCVINTTPKVVNCAQMSGRNGRSTYICADPVPPPVICNEHILWLKSPQTKQDDLDVVIPNYRIEEFIKAATKEPNLQNRGNINILLQKPNQHFDVQAQHGGTQLAKLNPNVNIRYEQSEQEHDGHNKKPNWVPPFPPRTSASQTTSGSSYGKQDTSRNSASQSYPSPFVQTVNRNQGTRVYRSS